MTSGCLPFSKCEVETMEKDNLIDQIRDNLYFNYVSDIKVKDNYNSIYLFLNAIDYKKYGHVQWFDLATYLDIECTEDESSEQLYFKVLMELKNG